MKVQLRAFGMYLGDVMSVPDHREELRLLNFIGEMPMIAEMEINGYGQRQRTLAEGLFRWNGDYLKLSAVDRYEPVEPVAIFDLVSIK